MVAENSANVKKHVRPPLRHMLMKSYEKLSGIVWTPSDKWLSALGIGAAQPSLGHRNRAAPTIFVYE